MVTVFLCPPTAKNGSALSRVENGWFVTVQFSITRLFGFQEELDLFMKDVILQTGKFITQLDF